MILFLLCISLVDAFEKMGRDIFQRIKSFLGGIFNAETQEIINQTEKKSRFGTDFSRKCPPMNKTLIPFKKKYFEYNKTDVIYSENLTFYVNLSYRHNMLYFKNPELVRFDSPFFNRYIENTNSKYYVLKDAYVNRVGGVVINSTFYQVPGPNAQTSAYPGIVIGCYNSVISLGTRFSSMFGHWMKDTLSPLFLLPEDVISNSMIVVTGNPSYALETLNVLGIDTNKTIILPRLSDYVFAKELHIIAGEKAFLCHFGAPLYNLSLRFRRAMNLSNEKPTKYAMFNRPANKFRSISNFDQLVEAVIIEFPQKNWEVWPETFPSIIEAGRNWNAAAFVYSPTGSNIDNALFMQPGSAICTPCANWYDFAVVSLGQVIGLWHVIYAIEDWEHFGDCSNPVDIEQSLEMIYRAIYAAENQRWPII
jgi:hypothetical protein